MILLMPALAAAISLSPGYVRTRAPTAGAVQAADSLRGRVTDQAGEPVPGARVQVLELERATRASRDGSFALGGLPPGTYTLRVWAPGLAPAVRRVRADADVGDVALAPASFQLDPVTVTAWRSPQAAGASPLASATLGPDRLRREHSVSLARTLGTLAGVRAVTTGEQVGKPVIRGVFGPRVAVLAGGVRLEDYSWSDEDAPSVDARLAERVEVIRGPASLLYGSDAVGGVVNVIPEPLPDAAGRAFTRAGVEAYFASGNLEGGVVGRAEGAAAGLGWRATVIGRMAGEIHTPDGEIPNTGFGALNGEAAAGLSRAWGTLALRYQRYGGEFKLLEAGGPPAEEGGGEEEGGPERKLSDDRLQLSGTFPLGGARIETRAQLQRHSLVEVADEPPGGGAPTGQETTQFDLLLNTATADVLAHLPSTGAGRVTLGAQGMLQGNDSRGPVALVPDAAIRSGGVFALWQDEFGPVRLLAGARVDHRSLSADANAALGLSDDGRDWTAESWNAGAVIGVARGLAVTAGVGRSWRAPTLFELYADGPRIGEARYDVGDPALERERGLELDGGLRWTGARARAEVSAFSNRIGGYIQALPTAQQQDGLRVYRYAATDALLRGVEAEAELRAAAPLTLRGAFDYVRGTERGTGADLAFIPPPRGRVEAEYRPGAGFGLPLTYLSAAVEGVARQTHAAENEYAPPAYATLDLGAGAERRLGGRVVRMEVQVRNATNTAYRSFLSRYKEFALEQGASLVLRLSSGI